MTPKQKFCLEFLSDRESSTWDVCVKAQNPNGPFREARCKYEWADAPFRELRNLGFIKKTGEVSRMNRAIHEITDEGRAALAKARGEQT